MIRLKPALLWISAITLLVCLGLFSRASMGDRPDAASATLAPVGAGRAGEAAGPSSAPPAEATRCGAAAAPLSLEVTSSAAAATCPAGLIFVCCACNGCGCRPPLPTDNQCRCAIDPDPTQARIST